MNELQSFFGLLVLTVLLLFLVAWTGKKAMRRVHLLLVAAAVGSLAGSIFFALKLGKLYDLEAAGVITPIHMFMARTSTACYLLPVVTGMMTLRNSKHRHMHGKVAGFVIAMTILATITGAIMLWKAPRI